MEYLQTSGEPFYTIGRVEEKTGKIVAYA